MIFEQEDSKAVIIRQSIGYCIYRIIETYLKRDEYSLKNELEVVEVIIRRGLQDKDDIVSGHFRLCSDLYKEYTKLSKPLIEEI